MPVKKEIAIPVSYIKMPLWPSGSRNNMLHQWALLQCSQVSGLQPAALAPWTALRRGIFPGQLGKVWNFVSMLQDKELTHVPVPELGQIVLFTNTAL